MKIADYLKRFLQKNKSEIKVGLVVMVGLIALRAIKDVFRK